MGDVKLATFENGADKACADWVLEVTKLIQKLKDDVVACNVKLGKKIEALPAPQSLADKDFAKLPELVNGILKQDAVRLKGIVDVELVLRVDAKAKKLRYEGYSLAGKVRDL